MNTTTVAGFLTKAQIQRCIDLAHQHGVNSCRIPIRDEVIQPNLDDINQKLGQENDPDFLAYTIQSALLQA